MSAAVLANFPTLCKLGLISFRRLPKGRPRQFTDEQRKQRQRARERIYRQRMNALSAR